MGHTNSPNLTLRHAGDVDYSIDVEDPLFNGMITATLSRVSDEGQIRSRAHLGKAYLAGGAENTPGLFIYYLRAYLGIDSTKVSRYTA